jgi:Ca-activated chloride channel family protein
MPDFGFDDWMDAELRNVPVPPDLAARLSASRPAPNPSDEALDAALRNVPVPPDLGRRLRRIARQDPWPLFLGKAALAASVLLLITGGGYYWLALPAASEPQKSSPIARAAQSSGVQKLAASPTRPRTSRGPVERQQPVEVRLGESLEATEGELPKAIANVAQVGSSLREAVEAGLRSQAALGSGGQIEPLPRLDVFEPSPPRGVSPPRSRGYDMLFHLRYGEHPFVSPAAGRELQTSRVPFSLRTTSYDAAIAEVQQGRAPAAERIRVEDFLAAQRYALPEAPGGGLAFHAAASPTPLGSAGQHLLQLAVQGGRVPAARRQPVRLIAVVDTSAAMRFDARARLVERALAGLVRHLTADDRLTLVGFAAKPKVLAEEITRGDLERMLATESLAEMTGRADLAGAMQSACDVLRAMQPGGPRRVVFITAGSDQLDENRARQAGESLAKLAAEGVTWQIVRLGAAGDEAPLGEWARTSGGKLAAAQSADELAAVLLEAVIARPTTTASGVSMRITFNPKVVTSYRLLGHEAATLTGDAADPLEIDLRAEQVATSLFELWLKPLDASKPQDQAGRAGDLAIVEILWRDPTSGQPRRSVQPIRRSQVAATFSEAPAWHQQAVLAARTAEIMRASYYVPNGRRLGQLSALAAEVDPRVASQRDFRTLVHLIEHADKLR